jgi:hypothetical protein
MQGQPNFSNNVETSNQGERGISFERPGRSNGMEEWGREKSKKRRNRNWGFRPEEE